MMPVIYVKVKDKLNNAKDMVRLVWKEHIINNNKYLTLLV